MSPAFQARENKPSIERESGRSPSQKANKISASLHDVVYHLKSFRAVETCSKSALPVPEVFEGELSFIRQADKNQARKLRARIEWGKWPARPRHQRLSLKIGDSEDRRSRIWSANR
ncbi:hypothetical protein B0H16DRAFT_1458250 [Mycena metata]|uniref:Uncharacterized protein n=1 Tax=Mycena metata TaxID=1033252 RepID=A0AAD7J3J9_9AGAR|nr:hypothetical protein B0H16DRAFT_1458250 [Mycena metata]